MSEDPRVTCRHCGRKGHRATDCPGTGAEQWEESEHLRRVELWGKQRTDEIEAMVDLLQSPSVLPGFLSRATVLQLMEDLWRISRREGVFIEQGTLERWTGRQLAPHYLQRLGEAIPNSTIPDSIDAIVSQFFTQEDEQPNAW
jgi:hypothetical protein